MGTGSLEKSVLVLRDAKSCNQIRENACVEAEQKSAEAYQEH